VKFLVDMPLSPRLVEWLNEQGHPSMHAVEAGLAQASDEHVLEYARSQGQIIITADLDYPRLLALTGEATPGIILFRGGDYSEREVRERLRTTFKAISSEVFASSVVVIEKTRVRRRPLPLE